MTTKPTSIEDFGHQFKVHDDEVSFKTCPVCGDSRWKVSVNARTGLWHCFAGSCGVGGRVDVGIDPAGLLGLVARHRRVETPSPWTSWPEVTISGAGNGLDWDGLRYLEERGMPAGEMQKHYHIFSRPGEIVFPFFDPLGRPVYWTSRDLTGSRPQKYLNMPGRRPLYVPHFATTAPMRRVLEIVVVEGVLDAISVHLAGFYTAAVGGTALPAYLRPELLDLVLPAGTVTIMLDSDAMAQAIKLAVSLQSVVNTRIVAVPRGQDPGNLDPYQVQELLK